MKVAFWIVAVPIAALYLFSGFIKLARTKDQLRPMMGWIDTVPLSLVRFIGLTEVLGALGLLLPPLIGVAQGLAFAAAIGLTIIQLGAIALHVKRGEVRLIGFNVVLITLSVLAIIFATVWI